MTQTKPFAFSISEEEVLAILGIIQGKGILGLDIEKAKSFNAKETKLLMDAAVRSLLARGFITLQGANLALAELVKISIGTCQFPEVTWYLVKSGNGKTIEYYYFHTLNELMVIHALPMKEIHQFITFRGRESGVKSILALIGLPDGEKESIQGSINIKQDFLVEIQKALTSKNSDEIYKHLTQQGVQPELVSAFATTLTSNSSLTNITRIDHTAEPPGRSEIGFLSNPESIWVIRQGKKDEFTFTQAKSKEAIRVIKECFV